MGELAERLDGIRVRVNAPGADIKAELNNRTDFTLSFGESVYEFIDERALERALASLARLLYAGWQRQYREAISDTGLDIDPNDQHDFNFQEECRAVESYGESGDGRVALSVVGMDEFTAQIKRGTQRELRESEFAARATEAAALLVEDYQVKTSELKVRYYG
ncbi:hypothetical protein FHX42_003698 [Saccharopolyspora lacisalsi]|uniref:Uncharacterized protein n=1 Tax=Halosaccharopolyspora lacisalsi TaxID=1000566 RepID=A0A839DWI6_9PSEU|nr:hypothetical protein [Halosaccharopolyspora lacisalsi]MBA8826322.1 hypothetical protein [Halosaccharopolyspora lacisalsi]